MNPGRSIAASVARATLVRATLILAVLQACSLEEDDPPVAVPLAKLAMSYADGNGERSIDLTTLKQTLDEHASRTEGVAVHHVTGTGAMIALELSHAAFEAEILGVTGPRARLNGRQVLSEGTALVIGTGFVAEYAPITPLGLLQLGGTVVSDLSKHGYTRVAGARDGALTIIGRAEYHRGLFESAMQIGPGIVEEGKLDISERELNLPAYLRAFVATCEASMLAGISTEPMHLYDLGGDLLAYFDRNGMHCDEVANLSGDRETLLAINLSVDSADGTSSASATRRIFVGDPNSIKASLIGFATRQKQ